MSDGILGQRAGGLGGGRLGGGGRRGALMGLGRLPSPAGGPQEALACGLASGRPAIVAVRWADRLRERRPSPHVACHHPSLPLHRCSGFGEQQAVQKQTKIFFGGGLTSPSYTSDIFHRIALIESLW